VVTDVSVVIPTQNRSTWLRQSLRSALAQIDVTIEVVVVDDGSQDDTEAVVRNMGDDRVALVRHQRSRGLSSSRNDGADRATGGWIAFIDDDDLWSPRKLALQRSAAEDAGRDWVYAGSVNIDDSLRVLGGRPPPSPDEVMRVIRRNNVVPGSASSVAIRRETFERIGRFDAGLASSEDWDMWLRLAAHGPPAWVPEPLVGLRLHASNMSFDVRAVLQAVRAIEERHGIHASRGPLYRWIAASYLRRGQKGDWIKYLSLAAARGEARGVVEDVAVAIGHRMDRLLGRPSKTLDSLPNPEWTKRAQVWLDELRAMLEPI
jgi:glycosyltransferase involved in cell wall biosynthesis